MSRRDNESKQSVFRCVMGYMRERVRERERERKREKERGGLMRRTK